MDLETLDDRHLATHCCWKYMQVINLCETIFFSSEDDGNINPYATFNQMKQVILEKEQQTERDKSPDFDDISLQKLEAQKAVCWQL